jgi:hypothetical protein
LPPIRRSPTVYVAKWDEERRQYVALSDDGALLGMSHLKGLAIGLARTAALDASRERHIRITVMAEDDDGKLRKHWTFTPPGKGHS